MRPDTSIISTISLGDWHMTAAPGIFSVGDDIVVRTARSDEDIDGGYIVSCELGPTGLTQIGIRGGMHFADLRIFRFDPESEGWVLLSDDPALQKGAVYDVELHLDVQRPIDWKMQLDMNI